MAVHDDYPGLTVQVVVNSEPLEEYKHDDEEELPKTTTCYIESKPGAEFAIKTSFTPPFEACHVLIGISLDGIDVTGLGVLERDIFHKSGHVGNCTIWQKEDKWSKSGFCFSDLNIVQDDEQAIGWERLKPSELLGTVKISLYRITKLLPNGGKDNRRPIGLHQRRTISEKFLKGDARSMQAVLGPVTEHDHKSTSLRSEREPEPFVTFRFKYRSISALKSLGFIPGSFSTTPNTTLSQATETGAMTEASKSHCHIATTTLTSQKETSAPLSQHEQDGVTIEEIIAMITGYRGHDKGLAGENRNSLSILLKYYENKDAENTTGRQKSTVNSNGNDNIAVKEEPNVIGNGNAHIKREVEESETVLGKEKRRKMEVIVLDD